MSNEEIIDEILHEAAALGLRSEVIDLSQKIIFQNPRMERVDAIELAFNHLKNYE